MKHPSASHSSGDHFLRGKFICVDGIDGAGKSTQISLLAKRLDAQGIRVHVTREPGGTPLGEQIRQLVCETTEPLANKTELLLMFAARAQHVEEVIRPKLGAGQWVICSRFSDATRAYQGYGRGMDLQVIDQLAELVHADVCPDLRLFLDIDVEESAKRIQLRGERLDRFETAGVVFMNKVRQGYLALFSSAENALCIDGTQDAETVSEQIWQAVARLPRT